MKRTVVINFLGPPCSGKSTTASQLFAYIKANTTSSVVLVQEEAFKYLMDHGKRPERVHEFGLFGKQTSDQSIFFNKVDFIISEGPVAMTAFYASLYGDQLITDTFKGMTDCWEKMCTDRNVVNVNVFVVRDGNYDEKGRYQDSNEIVWVEEKFKEYFAKTPGVFIFRETTTKTLMERIESLVSIV